MLRRFIVLSGGIGSGKSAVGAAMAARGAHIIEADRLGHEVLEPGGGAFDQVAERWPDVIVDGRVDRRALGRIVFGNAAELRVLESFTHPAIRSRIGELVDTSTAEIIVVELPLERSFLGEEWIRVVVDAPIETRIERLRERGMDDDEIEGRLAAQPSRDHWLDLADEVIDNGGTLEALDARVAALVERLSGPPDISGSPEPGSTT